MLSAFFCVKRYRISFFLYLCNTQSKWYTFRLLWWYRRNADLCFVLNSWQYDKYVALSHFYRPVAWKAGSWTFAVYTHYNRGHFYNAHPKVFVSYRGGHNRVHGSHYAHMHNTDALVTGRQQVFMLIDHAETKITVHCDDELGECHTFNRLPLH